MRGFDSERQKPIDNYIVDFYCKELKAATEITEKAITGKNTKMNKETKD